jgi:hypothetical protein
MFHQLFPSTENFLTYNIILALSTAFINKNVQLTELNICLKTTTAFHQLKLPIMVKSQPLTWCTKGIKVMKLEQEMSKYLH